MLRQSKGTAEWCNNCTQMDNAIILTEMDIKYKWLKCVPVLSLSSPTSILKKLGIILCFVMSNRQWHFPILQSAHGVLLFKEQLVGQGVLWKIRSIYCFWNLLLDGKISTHEETWHVCVFLPLLGRGDCLLSFF